MNGLIIGMACIFGILAVICVLFLIGVAIWQYCDGRYGENPVELFCDYFYDKGEKRREKIPQTELGQIFADVGENLRNAFRMQTRERHEDKEEEHVNDTN